MHRKIENPEIMELQRLAAAWYESAQECDKARTMLVFARNRRENAYMIQLERIAFNVEYSNEVKRTARLHQALAGDTEYLAADAEVQHLEARIRLLETEKTNTGQQRRDLHALLNLLTGGREENASSERS